MPGPPRLEVRPASRPARARRARASGAAPGSDGRPAPARPAPTPGSPRAARRGAAPAAAAAAPARWCRARATGPCARSAWTTGARGGASGRCSRPRPRRPTRRRRRRARASRRWPSRSSASSPSSDSTIESGASRCAGPPARRFAGRPRLSAPERIERAVGQHALRREQREHRVVAHAERLLLLVAQVLDDALVHRRVPVVLHRVIRATGEPLRVCARGGGRGVKPRECKRADGSTFAHETFATRLFATAVAPFRLAISYRITVSSASVQGICARGGDDVRRGSAMYTSRARARVAPSTRSRG